MRAGSFDNNRIRHTLGGIKNYSSAKRDVLQSQQNKDAQWPNAAHATAQIRKKSAHPSQTNQAKEEIKRFPFKFGPKKANRYNTLKSLLK